MFPLKMTDMIRLNIGFPDARRKRPSNERESLFLPRDGVRSLRRRRYQPVA